MGRPTAFAHHQTASRKTRPIIWASDVQRQAFEYGPAPACASGGFGSGKSFAFCLKAIALSDRFPKNRGVIVRREWEDLKATTMATFFKVCPPEAYRYGGRRADTEKYLRLNNGSEILWLHLRQNDPDIENIIKGLEINWFFIDQAEEVEEEIFDKLRSRLGRWDQAEIPEVVMREAISRYGKWPWLNVDGKPIPPTYGMIACNPDTEYHWIYRRFHPESPDHTAPRPNNQPSWKQLGYKMFIMNSLDNRYLTDQSKHEMTAQDEAFVRRYVRGEWGLPEGLIHQISALSHVKYSPDLIDYFRQHCLLGRVLDHGDSAPTACGWYAVDRNGNVFFYREYYQPDKLVSYHRERISELSQIVSNPPIYETYIQNLADPAIFKKMQQKHGARWCTADEYSDVINLSKETAIFWEEADNNELGTRNRISEYLRVDPDHIHPITKQKGSPRLFFVVKDQDYPNGVSEIMRQTRQQRRKKIGTENGKPIFDEERDESVPDHGYDLVRYVIASRPAIASAPQRLYSKNSFHAARMSLKKFQKAGGFKALAAQARREARSRR
jgi:hypothetical protein